MSNPYKSIRGWEAKSEFPLPENKVLVFLTMKRSSGALVTTARVNKIEGQFQVSAMSDFSYNVLSTTLRASEKAVGEQHAAALRKKDEILEKVDAFYSTKTKA